MRNRKTFVPNRSKHISEGTRRANRRSPCPRSEIVPRWPWQGGDRARRPSQDRQGRLRRPLRLHRLEMPPPIDGPRRGTTAGAALGNGGSNQGTAPSRDAATQWGGRPSAKAADALGLTRWGTVSGISFWSPYYSAPSEIPSRSLRFASRTGTTDPPVSSLISQAPVPPEHGSMVATPP